MSKENKEDHLAKLIEKLKDNQDKIDFTGVSSMAESMKVPVSIDFSGVTSAVNDLKKTQEELTEFNKRKLRREVENNESLKTMLQYNQQISDYNNELVNLNKKILSKINSLDDTLMFVSNSLIEKTSIDKEKMIEHNALLIELIEVIDSKDQGKLKEFMTNVGAPIGAGLIVEYFKMKLGISN